MFPFISRALTSLIIKSEFTFGHKLFYSGWIWSSNRHNKFSQCNYWPRISRSGIVSQFIIILDNLNISVLSRPEFDLILNSDFVYIFFIVSVPFCPIKVDLSALILLVWYFPFLHASFLTHDLPNTFWRIRAAVSHKRCTLEKYLISW